MNGAVSSRSRESTFLIVMSMLVTSIVIAGFYRTWFLRFAFEKSSLPFVVLLHGIAFTAWIALFVTQIVLIRTSNVALHRRLGWLGAVLAAAMVPLAFSASVLAVRRDLALQGGTGPFELLAVVLGDLAVFATLITLGVLNRSRPDAHKRYMLLGTLALLPAALARFAIPVAGSAFWYYGVVDLLALCCIVFDFAARRTVHRAFVYGAVLIVATQPLRFVIAGTETFIRFGRWLVG